MLGGTEVAGERDDARGRRGGRRRGGEGEHALEPRHVEQLGGESQLADLLDAGRAVAFHEAEERVHPPHACPREGHGEEGVRDGPDRRAVARGLALEERHVAQGVRGLLGGEVRRIGRAAPGRLPRMGLHERGAVVEADEGAVGPRPQRLAHEGRRERVERLGDLGVLITRDLRVRPQRHLVRRGRRRPQVRLLDRLEVLAGPPLGPGVAP